MPIDRRTVAPAPSDCSRARKDFLISRDVVMVLMCLMGVDLGMFLRCSAFLKMALDARLLLYAIENAVMMMKTETINFIERRDSFIDQQLEQEVAGRFKAESD